MGEFGWQRVPHSGYDGYWELYSPKTKWRNAERDKARKQLKELKEKIL
jgi:hypothetical protein